MHAITDEPQGFPNSTEPVWEVTNSRLALVRLHGRNAETWQKATATERFDYLYTDDELQEFVEPIKRTVAEANTVHVLFNNCRDDKAQLNAASLRKMLGASR